MQVIIDNILVICIVGGIIGMAFNLILRIKTLSGVTNSIINDTLKRDGKWSVTRLTMFTAWMAALWSYTYDIVKTGFNFDAFRVIVGVALGTKVTDAVSKKINPDIKPDENKS